MRLPASRQRNANVILFQFDLRLQATLKRHATSSCRLHISDMCLPVGRQQHSTCAFQQHDRETLTSFVLRLLASLKSHPTSACWHHVSGMRQAPADFT
jgi:hypothetical protein